MKISIENFKSIQRLHNFEIKPLTILSGVNSSGKSSFVQLLLLLKQTIEADSGSNPFKLDGDLYTARDYKDIVFNKQPHENKITVAFEFDSNEISNIVGSSKMGLYGSFDNYKSEIFIQFDLSGKKVFVSEFKVKISFPKENIEERKDIFVNFIYVDDENKYSIDANDNYFGNGIWNENLIKTRVNFLSFYPLYFETNLDGNLEQNFVKIDWVKQLVNSFFENISYLEPNRDSPKDSYSAASMYHDTIGTKGEFTAQVLEDKAGNLVEFYNLESKEEGIKYVKESDKTLIQAVKYWMCDVFEVADDIKTEKINEIYKIILVNKSGLETSIKHVGFGISQLLPIVVEGLRMSNNGTLIIEQPEIHLHPKLQSKLYDFLYGLTLQGKKVIVETHSSHFITRMRRRIAEDENNEMDDRIGLTFIEDNIFRSIELDDYGTMDYYPEDFIESSNTELRSIVKAQMKKRKRNGF